MRPITLIRPSGEITAKSAPVRKMLLGELARRLERRLGKVVRVRGPRLVVLDHHPDVVREFGVEGALMGYEVKPKPSIILRTVKRVLRDFPEEVRVDVRSHHEGVSGRALFESVKNIVESSDHYVDKRGPRMLVEVRSDAAYVCGPEESGPGGLPVGTQGTALCLLSGGFDSPVAAWMTMRRGLECKGLHFLITESEFEAARKNEQVLRRWCPEFELFVDETHREFLETAEKRLAGRLERYLCLVCKMRMLERALQWADRLECDCVVTGDSLGQVASQTIWNLRLVESRVDGTVLRPLVGLNKSEIIRYGREIGVPERDAGRCPFVPERPIVKPREREALRAYRTVVEG